MQSLLNWCDRFGKYYLCKLDAIWVSVARMFVNYAKRVNASNAWHRIVIVVLVLFLVAPRVVIYLNQGPGIVSTDAKYRYFPQAEKQAKSLKYFLTGTNPAYSTLLLLFKKTTDDMVVGPVILQHICGVVAALVLFVLLKRVNICLAFLVSLLTFSSERSIVFEHAILTDSLFCFLLVVQTFLLVGLSRRSGFVQNSLVKGLAAGTVSWLMLFFRIESIVLLFLFPFFLFFVFRPLRSAWEHKKGDFMKFASGYFLPFFFVFATNQIVREEFQFRQYTGAFFNAAYYYLTPDMFFYESSEHPELLASYKRIIEKEGTVRNAMGAFYSATGEYLKKHPEIEISWVRLMDHMFLEMILENPLDFILCYLRNLRNHILALENLYHFLETEPQTTGIKLVDMGLRFFSWPTFSIDQTLLNKVSFWAYVILLPFAFLNWHRLPEELKIASLVTIVHFLVLAGSVVALSRYRYPLEPFMYSVIIYVPFILPQAGKSLISLFIDRTKGLSDVFSGRS
jgi:hypothetical protein